MKRLLLLLLFLPALAGAQNDSSAAAGARALDNPDDMSSAVGRRLGEVIAATDAQKLDEAAAAMQRLRRDFDGRLNDYERFRVLQVSAGLNTALQKYPEAIADHEAILQMAGVPASDRLAAADATAQLYLQLADWSRGLEYLRQVNDIQGGRNMETLFRIAFSYSQLGQTAQAIPYMEQALAVGGERAGEDYYNNLAVLYTQAQRYDEAIETYAKLLNIAPNTANREAVSAELAALYIKVGNDARAKITLQGLIRAFPSSSRRAEYLQSLEALNARTR